MSDGILKVTGFGDFRRLHSEYKKQQQQIERLEKKLKDVGNTSQRSDREQEHSLGRTIQRVSSATAAYVSLEKAIQSVIAANQRQQELQNQANQRSLTLADSQAALLTNIGPSASNNLRSKIIEMSQQLGRQTGFGEAETNVAIGQLLSATEGDPGGKRLELVRRTFMAAEKMFRAPEQRAEIGGFGGAALSLTRGVPGLTPEQSVGIMSALMSQARITSPDQLKNLVPAMVAAQVTGNLHGMKPEDQLENTLQMGSILAALGGRIEDPDGRLTRTAGTSLAMLREFAPEDMRGKPIMDVIESISKDPKRVEAALGGRIGEAFGKIGQEEFIRGMLTAGTAREIRKELEITPEDMEQFGDAFTGLTPELRKADVLRRNAAQQDLRMRDSGMANVGAVRAFLFGGEIDGVERAGEIPSRIRTGMTGMGDQIAAGVAKSFFEGLMAGDDEVTNERLLQISEGTLRTFDRLDPMRSFSVPNRMRELERLIGTQTSEIKAGQTQGAAAAHAAAQQE